MKNRVLGLVIPLAIVFVWYMITDVFGTESYLMPSFIMTIKYFLDFIFGFYDITIYSGDFVANALASITRVIIGFSISTFLGISLGFITGRVKVLRSLIEPLINAIRTVPGIGWLPIFMVWFGIGETLTVLLIALAAFFPVYLNTLYGILETPKEYIMAAQMLGANHIKINTTVIFPWAFPSIITGLRLGLGVSWAYLVLGELTGINLGIGAVMMDSRITGQTEMIIVTMVVISLIGFISDKLLKFIGKCVLNYDEKR
ncbi:MAG TPA: ABC transporter permease [Anaerovoracaceae bacterium]|nr:ABC transporter permease [Anaerovoracaceae bacterium]